MTTTLLEIMVLGKEYLAKLKQLWISEADSLHGPPSSVVRAQGPQPCGRRFEPHGRCFAEGGFCLSVPNRVAEGILNMKRVGNKQASRKIAERGFDPRTFGL